MADDFLPTLSQSIVDLLKQKLGSAIFKSYYDGDPWAIPQSLLPAVAVVKESEEFLAGPTGMDLRRSVITVKVIFNKKDEFGKDPAGANIQRRMENIIAGLDPSTGEVSQSSILGIMRKHFTVDTGSGPLVLDQLPSVDYGVVPRPDDVITAEAHVTLRFDQHVVVSGRV